jgi:GntR family transcriptional regulator, carbon starvation induced regulator
MNRPPSLGLSVHDRLRGDILSARLKPGEKLRISTLTERYDCGASPVREALNQLASAGLVERRDRRGFIVSPASRDEFQDILRNRCLVESEALRLSMDVASERWQEEVLIAHHRLQVVSREDASSQVDVGNYEAAHRRFHMSLISGCGSPVLISICERLYDLNIRYRYLQAEVWRIRRREAMDEHDALKAIILGGDYEQAKARLTQHYSKTGKRLYSLD